MKLKGPMSTNVPRQMQSVTICAVTLLVLIFTSLLQIGDAQAFDCDSRCFSEYVTTFSHDCNLINSALLCYLEHQADCTGFLAQATIGQVRNDHDVMGCPEVTLTTDEVRTEPVTTPPPPLTILTCPRVPPYLPTSSAPNLPSPVIHPSTANRDCIEYDPRQLQHCSMFGFSSLRPFQSYRSGLEACNVPGSWYLLRHRTVTVEVEGMASGEAADHTIISKINVTFYRSGNCLGETKSYVATLNSPLPQNFTDLTVPSNCSANLQLSVDADGSVVSLLATWINTTIVIRRHADLLAVTVQVPGHLAFESDGLCRGCPAHAYFNMTRFNYLMSSIQECSTASNSVTFLCYFGFANRRVFNNVINASYPDVCIYSLWRGNTTSYDVLSLLLAVSNDAEMLPNDGNIPPRSYEQITVGLESAGDSCNPPNPANSSQITTNTIDSVTRASDSSDQTETSDSSLTTTTMQSTPSKHASDMTTLAEVGSDNISSSTCTHQRVSTAGVLTASILLAFLVRLFLR